jgi:hypothetical protein
MDAYLNGSLIPRRFFEMAFFFLVDAFAALFLGAGGGISSFTGLDLRLTL